MTAMASLAPPAVAPAPTIMTEVNEKGTKRTRGPSTSNKKAKGTAPPPPSEPATVTEEETFSLVVTKSAKEKLKRLGCHTGGDVITELNGLIEKMLVKAAGRCLANGRKTVKVDDL